MANPPRTHQGTASGKPSAAKAKLDRNVHEFAALIVTEAGGQGPAAETAVGWTVPGRNGPCPLGTRPHSR